MCVCVYGCVHAYGCVCVGACTYVHTHVLAGMGILAYMHLGTFACVCGWVGRWVGMCVYFKGFCYCLYLSMFRNIIIFTVQKY